MFAFRVLRRNKIVMYPKDGWIDGWAAGWVEMDELDSPEEQKHDSKFVAISRVTILISLWRSDSKREIFFSLSAALDFPIL